MKAKKEIIVLGSDHGGFRLKQKVKRQLSYGGYHIIDVGSFKRQPDDDYPLYALLVASKVVKLERQRQRVSGILICRSGGGMALAANKVKGARAADAFSVKSAKHARQHNQANILTLGQDFLSIKEIQPIIKTWLKTEPSLHPRHARRLQQISQGEQGQIEVTPGILEKTLADIKRRFHIVAGLSKTVHLDVADNTLVPNKTFLNLTELKQVKIKASKEAHLMVNQPLDYLPAITAGGFKLAFVHIESRQAREFIPKARRQGLRVGLAIDINTPVVRLKKLGASVDSILIMGIKAGFAGQEFKSEALSKIVKIKQWWPKKEVILDGGVHEDTVKAIAAAGANRVIANSAVFGAGSAAKAISKLTHYDQL